MFSMGTIFSEPPEKKQYHFKIKDSDSIGTIELVQNADSIDKDVSRSILVEAFISEYEQYLLPNEISENSNSWRNGDASVKKYYEDYFNTELTDFTKGVLHYWVKISVDGVLAGWATFQREKSDQNSVYMNLLVVHPDYQHKGIGKQLVMALINLGEIKDLNAVHLLLRKKNQGGRIFYSKLGFYSDQEYRREDNFVDLNLLEGMTWKNPELQITNQTNRQELRNSGVTRTGIFSQLVASVDDQSNNLTPLQESLLSGFIGFAGSKKP